MNVIIRHCNVPPSPALAAHCRLRVARAVEPFEARVERVEVVLEDQNGPRKGPGHACRVLVQLTTGRSVMFACKSRDFYLAASRAAAGAGRHLARALDKARARTRARFVRLGVA